MSADNLKALDDAADILAPIRRKIADASDAFGAPQRASLLDGCVVVVYEDATKLAYSTGRHPVELIYPGSRFIPNL